MSASAQFFPGAAQIEAYGNGGFRFAGMSHRGSILCLPSGIRGWPVTGIRTLTAAGIGGVLAEVPPVEFLLLGCGQSLVLPPADVVAALRAAGIGIEPMNTGAAARTYNVLLAEGRRIGAALIAVE